MENKISNRYWIWGQFDDFSMDQLNLIYKRVNKSLKGPLFNIHLTLSGPIKKTDEAIHKFDSLKGKINSIDIFTNKYSYSDKFYQSLYINIKKTKDLKALKFNIDKKFNLRKTIYDPHISLYYGNSNEITKTKLIKTLPKTPKILSLNKLCLVNVNEKINKWKIEHKLILSNYD